MTMIPAENLSKQQHHHHPLLLYGGYGGCGASSYSESFGHMSRIQGYDHSSEACLGSDLFANPMAGDESRTNSLTEAGSSTKENPEESDEGWLQLSIGGRTTSHEIKHNRVDPTARRGGLIELDLLPGGGSHQARPLAPTFLAPEFQGPRGPVMNIPTANCFSTSVFFQQQGSSSTFPHHQEINWAFRPIPPNIAMASSSSSQSFSSLMPFGSYCARPFQVHTGIDIAGPSSDFRIIDPPRRPHSGIWFMLLASQNQGKEPFLPQIPKSYLRIKDGRMTVRLLIKYLVNKLRLDSESEVEMRCRGQQLQPFLTLQHVRDSIWSSRDAVTLLAEAEEASSSNTDHVMVLHYARSSS